MSESLGRGRRCELLAAADLGALLALADRCIETTDDPVPITGPEVGLVMLTVREPVESIRFHLSEVLVTRAEVLHRGERGWAMAMGDARSRVVAAAVCDAEAAADGPLTAAVDALCRTTEVDLARARDEEWEALAPTIVRFEEVR